MMMVVTIIQVPTVRGHDVEEYLEYCQCANRKTGNKTKGIYNLQRGHTVTKFKIDTKTLFSFFSIKKNSHSRLSLLPPPRYLLCMAAILARLTLLSDTMENAKSKSPEQKPRIESPNKSMTGIPSSRSSSRMHSNIEHSIMEQALADAFLVYMGLEVSTPYRCFDYLSTSPDHPPTDAYNNYVDHIFSSLPSDPSGPMTEV